MKRNILYRNNERTCTRTEIERELAAVGVYYLWNTVYINTAVPVPIVRVTVFDLELAVGKQAR